MKALKKDRSHRYESAIGLVHDLKRLLDGERVAERPHLYRATKLVQVARWCALVTVLATAIIVLGTVARKRTASGLNEPFLFYLSVGEDDSGESAFHSAMNELVNRDDLSGFVHNQSVCSIMDDLVSIRVLDAAGVAEGCSKAVGSEYIEQHGPFIEGMTLANSPAGKPTRSPQMEFVFAEPVRGFGTWVFDDSKDTQQHFFIQAWNSHGESAISPDLDNPDSRKFLYHWVEGFIGVSSPDGLTRVVITQVIDSGLGRCAFEVDNVQVAPLGG